MGNGPARRQSPTLKGGAPALHLAARLLLAALILPPACGCLVTEQLPDEAPVRDEVVRETGARYALYVPSNYSPQRRWPLVVLCHGTIPYDTAAFQMREWAAFAEKQGIIVAAPELTGTKGDLPPAADVQLGRQRADERTILGLVAAVRAAHNVAEERIFLTGWSGGGYAVLHTGLRHPEVFRALAVRQGTFDPAFMTDVERRLDRWQPIYIYYGTTDPVRDQSLKAAAWLRDHGLYVETKETTGIHRRLPVNIAWDFFREIAENRPWIRLGAVSPDYRRPRRVRFTIKAVPAATDALWNFGDGETGRGVEVYHEYSKDGAYDVAAAVSLEGGKRFRRAIGVLVPHPAMTTEPEDSPIP